MSNLKPQRSVKSATADLDKHMNNTSAINQWFEWCNDNGVIPVTLRLYQWVRTNAPHKSCRNKSLSVMLKDGCIHVKNWITGDCFTLLDYQPNSVNQCRANLEKSRRSLIRAARERRAVQAEAARKAERLWSEATYAPVLGYFVKKGLADTHGARWHERLQCWLVPVTDINGTIYSVQRIYNNKKKLNLKGGRVADGMFTIGSLVGADKVLVCEGFATGCTLREKSGATVVVAFSHGNLMGVCKAIRATYPFIRLVICADDDRQTAGNPGRSKAEAAARATGAGVVFPPLCANCKCTDFNDVALCTSVTP